MFDIWEDHAYDLSHKKHQVRSSFQEYLLLFSKIIVVLDNTVVIIQSPHLFGLLSPLLLTMFPGNHRSHLLHHFPLLEVLVVWAPLEMAALREQKVGARVSKPLKPIRIPRLWSHVQQIKNRRQFKTTTCAWHRNPDPCCRRQILYGLMIQKKHV